VIFFLRNQATLTGRPTNKEEGINGAPAVFLPSHAHGILRILQEKGRRAALLGNAALVIGRRRGSQGRGHEEGSSEARRRATHHDLCFTIVVCDFFRERISSVSVQGKRAAYQYMMNRIESNPLHVRFE